MCFTDLAIRVVVLNPSFCGSGVWRLKLAPRPTYPWAVELGNRMVPASWEEACGWRVFAQFLWPLVWSGNNSVGAERVSDLRAHPRRTPQPGPPRNCKETVFYRSLFWGDDSALNVWLEPFLCPRLGLQCAKVSIKWGILFCSFVVVGTNINKTDAHVQARTALLGYLAATIDLPHKMGVPLNLSQCG